MASQTLKYILKLYFMLLNDRYLSCTFHIEGYFLLYYIFIYINYILVECNHILDLAKSVVTIDWIAHYLKT